MTRIKKQFAAMLFLATLCCGGFAVIAADSVQKQIEDAEKRFWSASADQAEMPKDDKWDTNEKGFPKIDGIWDDGVEGKARQVVNFKQVDDKFTATCVYQNPQEGEFHWRFEGSITKDGRITGKLRHTKGPKYMLDHIQIHIAILSPDGATIMGRAIYHDGGGGHDYGWACSTNGAAKPDKIPTGKPKKIDQRKLPEDVKKAEDYLERRRLREIRQVELAIAQVDEKSKTGKRDAAAFRKKLTSLEKNKNPKLSSLQLVLGNVGY